MSKHNSSNTSNICNDVCVSLDSNDDNEVDFRALLHASFALLQLDFALPADSNTVRLCSNIS